MPSERDKPPIRSRLAIALVKGGLALGLVWVVTLLAFAARTAMALF